MKLEDLGIKPAPFSQASHLAWVQVDSCTIIVPCCSEGEALWIRDTLHEHYQSANDRGIE